MKSKSQRASTAGTSSTLQGGSGKKSALTAQHPKTMACLKARLESIVEKNTVLPPSKTQQYSQEAIQNERKKSLHASLMSGGGQKGFMKGTKSSESKTNASEDIFMSSTDFKKPNSPEQSPFRSRSPPIQPMHRPLSPEAVQYTEDRQHRLHRSKISQRLFEAIQGPRACGVGAELLGAPGTGLSKPLSSIGSSGGGTSRQGGGGGGGGDSGLDDYTQLMATDAHKTMVSITLSDYWAVRSLFTEIDDDGGGWLSIAELLRYQTQHPKRVKKDIFQNLILDQDGKVFFDEFLKIHFPKLSDTAIESMIEAYEPKSQNVDILTEESMKAIEGAFYQILEEFPLQGEEVLDGTESAENAVTNTSDPLMLLLGAPPSLTNRGGEDSSAKVKRTQSVLSGESTATPIVGLGGKGNDAMSMFSVNEEEGLPFSKRNKRGGSAAARRVSVGGTSIESAENKKQTGRSAKLGKGDQLGAPSEAGSIRPRSAAGKMQRAASIASHDRVSTASALFKKFKEKGRPQQDQPMLTLHQIFRAFEKPCKLTVSQLIDLFLARGVTELTTSLPISLFHFEQQRREREVQQQQTLLNLQQAGVSCIALGGTPTTTSATPFLQTLEPPRLTVENSDGYGSVSAGSRGSTPQVLSLGSPKLVLDADSPSTNHIYQNNHHPLNHHNPPSAPLTGATPRGSTTGGLGSSSLAATKNIAPALSELLIRLSSIVSGARSVVSAGNNQPAAGKSFAVSSNHKGNRQPSEGGGSSSYQHQPHHSELKSTPLESKLAVERHREVSQVAQWNNYWASDPGSHFLLNSVFITLPQFKILMMEYYVMRQGKMEIEAYNPRWAKIQAKLKWHYMFPYTGEIKDYFQLLLPLEPVPIGVEEARMPKSKPK